MNFTQYLAPEQPHICIPFVYKDITDTKIIDTFKSLNLGTNITIQSKITVTNLEIMEELFIYNFKNGIIIIMLIR